MTFQIHTLRWGNPDWLQLCAPTLDAWCERHNLPLTIWDDTDRGYPSIKFVEKDMLEAFLASDATHFLYIDSDVYVHPQAPAPDFKDGFHATTDDPHIQWIPRWREWCRQTFDEIPNVKFLYRNAGVWVCDRKSAEIFLKHFQPPFHAKVQEQHHFNYALSKAVDDGMVLNDLDGKWNRHAGDLQPAWFFHLFGTKKMEAYARFEKALLVPHRPEPFVELPVPELNRAIVYPWKDDDARWHELRYSLRSVEKFFEPGTPIFILGTRKPLWLIHHPRVTFLDCWTYTDAITRGCQLAKEVLWMNDDILFLRQTQWGDCRTPLYLRPVHEDFMVQVSPPSNPWQSGILRALADLSHHGCEEPLLFSTHTPYVFPRGQAVECFRQFGVWPKIPLEMILFNRYAKNPVQMTDERVQELPFGTAKFLNFTDKLLKPELKDAIKSLLPDFAPWELKIPFES